MTGPDLSKILVVGRDLPAVVECNGHPPGNKMCRQCDGSHTHQWRRCLVVNGSSFDVAHRCLACGARKCDVLCVERRHHVGPHLTPSGTVRQVGK